LLGADGVWECEWAALVFRWGRKLKLLINWILKNEELGQKFFEKSEKSTEDGEVFWVIIWGGYYLIWVGFKIILGGSSKLWVKI